MRLALLVVLSATLIACAETARTTSSQLKTRASFDFGCPKSQLETVTIDDRTEGVKGCGQQATYVRQCETTTFRGLTVDEDCTWVLNTNTKRLKKADDDGD